MQDILTAASLVIELSISALPFVHIASKLMPRKSQPVPGQLELPLFDPAIETERQLLDELIEACQGTVIEPVPDPWESLEKETVVPVPNKIAPLHTSPVYLQLLPPARDQAPAKPDYSAMTRDQLRKACQQQGVKWRDVHGRNKHLTVEEMRSALAAAA